MLCTRCGLRMGRFCRARCSRPLFTTQARGGLIAIELKRGKIAHQSPSIQDLTS